MWLFLVYLALTNLIHRLEEFLKIKILIGHNHGGIYSFRFHFWDVPQKHYELVARHVSSL